MQEKLREQFVEAAAMIGHDVCQYRAFDEYERPKAAAAFGAIAEFQRLISVVYGALQHGYKQRATIPEHVARETAFDFGFGFHGSVGIMLTIRNAQELFETGLDDTISTVFSMSKSKNPSEVLHHAHRLGPGPINALYEWAAGNANNGLGAEIEWRHGGRVKGTLFVQPRELAHLRKVIDETSTVTEQTVTVEGKLIAADVETSKFKLKRKNLPLIRGLFDPEIIDEDHRVQLPARCTATLRKITTIKYSTGTEDVQWRLLAIDQPRGSELGNLDSQE
ncbi:MAG: hypothetical protein DCC68_03825 [Planctomycetota bacterium]|nr:MAG: hypothetical protein DCC68_03825 [Planctomycetota bacterium]